MSFPEGLTDAQMRDLYDAADLYGLHYLSGDRRGGTLTGDFGGMGGAKFGRKLRAFQEALAARNLPAPQS